MPKTRIDRLIENIRSQKPKIIGLTVLYFIVTEIVMRMPYFNLYTLDWQGKIAILYLFFVYWFYPKYYFLIFISLLFLLFGKFGEVAGILIYISLLIVFVKLLLDRKAVVD